jgi:nitroreductase
MQSFLDTIKGRRSIRRFTSQLVDQETLTTILDAARWAPSWANTQCWEIIVVQDGEIRAALSKLLSPKNPATLAVANAPITLALCAQQHKSGFYKGEQSTVLGDWMLYDLGLLNQTICLTAQYLGLGTVIVGLFDHLQTKALLQVPEGYEVVSLIPLGYPDQAPSPPKRRELKEFVHYDRFGNR